MNRRLIIPALILAVLSIALGFYFGQQRATGPSVSSNGNGPTVAPPKVQAVYAMNVVVSGVPFWADTKATWQAIGKAHPDVNLLFGGPDNTDAQRQIDEINALLEKKLDGLVIAPADSAALTQTINKAVDRGIPVITYLVDAPSSKRLTYVASELETASERVAAAVTAKTPATGKALIVYAQTGNAEQEARRRGFEQFISRNRGMRLVGVIEDNYDESKGAELIKAALVKHPDLKFIFGCNSRSAVGAASALRETRGSQPGSVVVTGWDTDQDVLDLIKQGWAKASVAQHSSFMTQEIFAILEARRKGYLYPASRSFDKNGVRPVPEQIVVPTIIITAGNVDGFYPRQR